MARLRSLFRGPTPRLTWHVGLGREVGTVFWAMFFLEGAFGAYLGIWPLWVERLGAPVTVVGLVLGSSGLLRLFVLAPSAALADRFGARRLIIGARVAAGLGLLSAALAQHCSHLFVMVVLSALGELAFPLIQSHVATHAAANRVRSFTLVFTVGPSVALGLGPLLSGALIALWGLRAAFVLAAVLTALSVLCFARLRGFGHDAGTAPVAPASYRDALAETSIRRLLALQGATVFALALGTSFVPTFLEDVRGFSAAAIAQMGAGRPSAPRCSAWSSPGSGASSGAPSPVPPSRSARSASASSSS
jgi:MFS family permease